MPASWAPWRELPPVEMAEHLLVTPTIPDTAWTQEPRLRGELRSAFIVRTLAPELAVAPEEKEVPREPLAG